MKIRFMGTGAADWKISERVEGEFFRRLTSALVDEELMIDCSADTKDYVEQTGNSLKNVRNLLITHTHGDHYSPDTIKELLGEDITIWAEKYAAEKISSDLPGYCVKELNPFTTETLGDYTVTGVSANHTVADKKQIPMHYIIERGNKTVFWGCDGAWFLCSSWHEIKNHKYDLVVLDGTLGEDEGDYRIFEHNNLRMICEIADTMRTCETIKGDGKIIISHMARYAHKSHEELKAYMSNFDIEVAYDGMEMEI